MPNESTDRTHITAGTQHSTSLYNKYRPSNFDQVVGQDIPVSTMKNALVSGRVANAYLLTGQRGVGKTSTARIFAKALLCTGRESDSVRPCGTCEVCRCFARDDVMTDFIELDAASNRGVAEIRTLIERLSLAPQISNRKVVLIDEVHQLTKEAVSALLKVLEEPPSGVVFMLATTEANKIPGTIRSRCVWLRFRPLASEEISAHLAHLLELEGIECEDGVCDLVAMQAGGGLRDAISMLDQVLVYSGKGRIGIEDARACVGSMDDRVVCALADIYMQGKTSDAVGYTVRAKVDDIKELLLSFGDLVSNALIASQCGGEIVGNGKLLSEACRNAVMKMSETKSVSELLCMRNAIERHVWKTDEAMFDSHHVFNEVMLYGMHPEYDAFDHKSVERILNGVKMSYKEIKSGNDATLALVEVMQAIANQQQELKREIREMRDGKHS